MLVVVAMLCICADLLAIIGGGGIKWWCVVTSGADTGGRGVSVSCGPGAGGLAQISSGMAGRTLWNVQLTSDMVLAEG